MARPRWYSILLTNYRENPRNNGHKQGKMAIELKRGNGSTSVEGLNGKSIFKLRLRLYVPPYTLSASELGICSLSMIGTLFEQVCYEDVSFLSSPPLWLLSTVFNQSCHLVAGSSASLALASTGEIYGVLLRDVSGQSLVGVTD
nr:hypothetical protein Iba_chr09dCG13870 [Ipomoea batatas]